MAIRRLIAALTIGLGLAAMMPTQALAFGSKRYAHPPTASYWAKALRTLLNGNFREGKNTLKVDPELLGRVQTGPYIMTDTKDRQWLWLTTRDHDHCRLLRKPIADLERPEIATLLEDIDCDDGKEIRLKAQLPKFPGYAPVSQKGSELLNRLSDMEWSASRDCILNGNDEDRQAFSQSLQLQFMEDMFEKQPENRKELDIYSRGHAFSEKTTCVMREWRVNPIKVKLLLEQRAPDGTWRFLLWGDRFTLPTDEQNRMTIAAVNPVLMNSPDPLALYSRNKVCAGEKCYRLSDIDLTRLLPAQYLVIELNPVTPQRLVVRLMQVTAEMPEVELVYTSRKPAPVR